MELKTIDAVLLKKMFLAGAKSVEAKKEYINELNVFPVPDGDTGTNMSLTILAAAKEVDRLEEVTVSNIAKAISGGSLRGARGNSGVILSQLFRGFTKEIQECEEIDVPTLSRAFAHGVKTAYRAVMKPKEGTILTVARAGAERAAELAETVEDVDTFCKEVIIAMEEMLVKTPDMLPVLKEAGVVDSGGQGLLEILKGAYEGFLGKKVQFDFGTPSERPVSSAAGSDVSIHFGYCTEFIVMVEKEYNEKKEQEFKSYLESIGDSIVCVSDDGIIKVHVHTNDPGLAIQKGLTFGSLTSMKIDNMREEHNERFGTNTDKGSVKLKEEEKKTDMFRPASEKKTFGFIAVSSGDGIDEIFMGLGVDYLIKGGQTMNPSTEDMLNAIEQVNADHIFILPNNKNIILAAEQARELTDDKNIIVIPTKTIPQGITSVIHFVGDKTPKENEQKMLEEIQNVKSGQVTYAVRDTSIDGKTIHQGDIMGLSENEILSVGGSVERVTEDLLLEMVDENAELISLYYGSETSEEDAMRIADHIEETFPDIDVEVHMGGQPIYYYIVSVE